MSSTLNASTALPQRKIAIYPGSFDPVTRGHLDIAQRIRPEFDHLIVAIGHNPNKSSHLFTTIERAEMLRDALQGTDIEVDTFEGLLANYAAGRGADVVVRGLRGWRDWPVEVTMMGVNFVLGRGLRTRFVDAAPNLAHVSSSKAREAAARGEQLDSLVPPSVASRLRRKYEHQASSARSCPQDGEYAAEPLTFGRHGSVALRP